MVAREAVQAAKEFIKEMFADEGIVELGLEELDFVDEASGVWEVTFGFRRQWQAPYGPRPRISRSTWSLASPEPQERTHLQESAYPRRRNHHLHDTPRCLRTSLTQTRDAASSWMPTFSCYWSPGL